MLSTIELVIEVICGWNFGHVTLSEPVGFEALSTPDYATGAV